MSLIAICLALLNGALPAQDSPRDRFNEAINFLDGAHTYLRSAEAREKRVTSLVRYLKKRMRGADLSVDDRRAMKAEITTLEGREKELRDYQKAVRDYLIGLEKYLHDLAAVSPEVDEWNKARRRIWKGGRPPIYLELSPQGTVTRGQRVRIRVVGVPDDAEVVWTVRNGNLMQTEMSRAAILTSTSASLQAKVSVEVRHPLLTFPVNFNVSVDHSGTYTQHPEVSDDLFEEALARLISLETARVGLDDEIKKVRQRVESARERGIDAMSPSFVELNTRLAALEQTLVDQDAMIEYLDTYRLPRIAEASGRCDHWEIQRQDVQTTYQKPERIFPWRIEKGARSKHEEWHFIVPDLPFETKVRWSLRDETKELSTLANVVDVNRQNGDETYGVLVSPWRNQEEILTCRIDLPFHDLPIRLDWRLPANPQR